MGSRAVEIVVSERQRGLLEKWVRNKADTPYRFVERCRIVLMSADGVPNVEQGRRLGADQQRARRWRRRWLEGQERLLAAEEKAANDKDLGKLLVEVLSDRRRAGVTPTFSAVQLTKIIAIACELPEESGRPVTHWTAREVADEAIKRGVVESISRRHVDRLLKGGISVRTRASTG
jgi:putative transposase